MTAKVKIVLLIAISSIVIIAVVWLSLRRDIPSQPIKFISERADRSNEVKPQPDASAVASPPAAAESVSFNNASSVYQKPSVPAVSAGLDAAKVTYSLDEVETAPTPIAMKGPKYPPELLGTGIKGEAIVSFVVGEDGSPEDVETESATHPAFAAPAEKAVKTWRMSPAMKDGKNVRVKMRVPLLFNGKAKNAAQPAK